MNKKIYVVDDQIEITDLLVRVLNKESYETQGFYNASEVIEQIKEEIPNLILLDVQMPKIDGFEALRLIKKINPNIPIIIMTAYADKGKSNYFLENGALDFVSKPIKLKDIRRIVKEALTKQVSDNKSGGKYNAIIGSSDKIKQCLNLALKLSNSESPILVTGESGTGKELIVDFIHYNSVRKNKNLIKINCAAIPSELLESELFGYEKGAFTGANTSKPGKIEEANGGTLFLDEICEMDLKLQAKLLRILESKSYERLGSNLTLKSDFRIICATNKDVEREVKEGRFRKDLYYRINTFTIELPPLRERKEDTPQLVYHFINMFKEEYLTISNKISEEVISTLLKYEWPGNIRELKNVVERMISVATDEIIGLEDVPKQILDKLSDECHQIEGVKTLEDIEKEYIIKILCNIENKKEASQILGISERTLYNKIKKYKI